MRVLSNVSLPDKGQSAREFAHGSTFGLVVLWIRAFHLVLVLSVVATYKSITKKSEYFTDNFCLAMFFEVLDKITV